MRNSHLFPYLTIQVSGVTSAASHGSVPWLLADVRIVHWRCFRFALKGADSTTGPLKTLYDGARPSHYQPMKYVCTELYYTLSQLSLSHCLAVGNKEVLFWALAGTTLTQPTGPSTVSRQGVLASISVAASNSSDCTTKEKTDITLLFFLVLSDVF